MAKLPGILFIIVGLGVIIISYLAFREGAKLVLFGAIGIGMFVFGTIRTYFEVKTKLEKRKKEKEYYKKIESIAIPKQQTITEVSPIRKEIKFCPNCQNVVRINEQYCLKCRFKFF